MPTSRPLLVGLCVIALVVLTACGERLPKPLEAVDPPPGEDAGDGPPLSKAERLARELRASYGTAPAIEVRGNMRIKPPGEDAVDFNLRIEFDEAGTAFVRSHKYGHHLFDALIGPDTATTMLLVHEELQVGPHDIVRGRLDDLQRPADARHDVLTLFATNLHHILNEFRLGPVPPLPATALTADIDGALLTFADEPTTVQCRLDDQVREVEAKALLLEQADGEPTPVLRLRYRRYQTWASRMKRARDIRVQIPDNPVKIRVTIDTVDEIEHKQPLALDLPDDATIGSLQDFLDEIGKRARAEAERHRQAAEAQGAP